jgi:hypothetical protein
MFATSVLESAYELVRGFLYREYCLNPSEYCEHVF